jgi:DNA polymerase-3 subunit gamma/tau
MTLYLKYRSKTINELDLKDVRESLDSILKSGNIPHAFLFSGPKGSGKTSAARILAKIVNCENLGKDGTPCNKCDNCLMIARGESLDVLELDAASHRGIDDIRALRDAVKLAPARAKKKIYIIDEAHMLTPEASNALLKTLEEPPDHVIFILATTNPEKLIETIRSRVVNIRFRKATNEEIARSLARVIKGENLKIEADAVNLIAKASDGSFRDAIKILEQLTLEGVKLGKIEVEDFLFSKKTFDPDKFIDILVSCDEKEAFLEIEKAVNSGASVKNICRLLLERLRVALLAKVGVSDKDINSLSKEDILLLLKLISRSFSEIPEAILEQIPLEIAIAEWCQVKNKTQSSKIKNSDETNEIKSSSKNDKSNNTSQDSKKEEGSLDSKVGPEIAQKEPRLTNGGNGFSQDIWIKVLTQIRPKNTSTEALLRASKPVAFDGKTLTLGVYYKFHKERLETSPHRDILESALSEVTGDGVRVVCTLTHPPERVLKDENANQTDIKTNDKEVILSEGQDEEIIRVAKEIFGS